MVKSSLPSQKRTLLLVIGLELWVIGIALYALLKERIVPSWDFYLILGGSLLLSVINAIGWGGIEVKSSLCGFEV